MLKSAGLSSAAVAAGVTPSTPSLVVKIAASAIPLIDEPSGTMANNGVFTRGTALAATYANAWSYFAAGAIFAGSVAGWYFTQSTSATAGTVFNNTYVSGTPTIPAVPTPFVTTGPGAYTGVITLQSAIQINVPGNSMGPNGTLRYSLSLTIPNNANSKNISAAYSTFVPLNSALTTSASAGVLRSFSNRGVTNSQVGDGGTGLLGPSAGAGAQQFGAIDSTQTQVFALQVQLAVATDYIVIEKFLIEVMPG